MNLKHTQSKIWNEFNKEVNYLRRVFNELQLSKVKVSDPVARQTSLFLLIHFSTRNFFSSVGKILYSIPYVRVHLLEKFLLESNYLLFDAIIN